MGSVRVEERLFELRTADDEAGARSSAELRRLVRRGGWHVGDAKWLNTKKTMVFLERDRDSVHPLDRALEEFEEELDEDLRLSERRRARRGRQA